MNTSAVNTMANILMVSTLQKGLSPRPLYLNYELYTDGDAAFKGELSAMMIENIQELRQSLHDAISQQQPDIFQKACHKTKVALHMLEDQEFTDTTEEIKSKLHHLDKTGNSFSEQIALFDALSDAVIYSLELEIKKDQ